jgi:hypothetical protein
VTDIGVGVFVYRNRSRRVRAINNYITIFYTSLADKRLNPAGNINHLVSASAAYFDIFR